MGLYWVPGHARVQGNEIAHKLALMFLAPKLALGVSDVTYKKGLVTGWLTSNGQNGKALVTPKYRLEN